MCKRDAETSGDRNVGLDVFNAVYTLLLPAMFHKKAQKTETLRNP